MKDIFTVVVGLLLMAVVWAGWTMFGSWKEGSGLALPPPGGVMCTMDAKLCPDGSYVGRTGPKCEFAPCPGGGSISSFEDCVQAGYPVMESYPRQCKTPEGRTFVEVIIPVGGGGGTTSSGSGLPAQSGIRGVVMLGPTCPVMREPPDPECADKPYATTLVITSDDGARVLKTIKSAGDGSFALELPPGAYSIRSMPNANILPRCASEIFAVMEGAYAHVVVSCDSGIR